VKREKAEATKAELQLAPPDLVLKSPQHYHVQVITYESVEPDGKTFAWSTQFDLVANDIELASSRARALAGRPLSHVTSVRQCSESQHLEGV
jgi:hypothetical protein